ncbi:riboflavin kinase [Malassezia sp. CBS 17886]|nr:riboflavin kinase [Malassezia sp. CBS 17886]
MPSSAGRPETCGADVPEPPFPVRLDGIVGRGFGRGGKQLNCPTANLPAALLDADAAGAALRETGVYFGFAQVLAFAGASVDRGVYPMVMSVGWNPTFMNKEKSIEVHVMHAYDEDFYGDEMRVIVLGYMRPEFAFTTLDALVSEIETDKRVGKNSLARHAYEAYQKDPFFA